MKLFRCHCAPQGTAAHLERRYLSTSPIPIRIAIIGCGKMAEAAARGLKAKSHTMKVNFNVFDINHERCELFTKAYDATSHGDIRKCVEGVDFIFLSCKPQNIKTVGSFIKGSIDEKTVVCSILAGTTLSTLEDCLGAQRIVRSMPNTPAAVQEGITVWTSNGGLSPEDKKMCATVLAAFGDELMVDDEQYLDMATALSGSGPAYVLLLMESMIETGVHFGFPRSVATRLVHQTVKGTAVLAMKSDINSASMRADITSPGGTTASALYSLEKGGFRTVVADGLWSAYRRSLELGGKDSVVGPDRYKK